VPLAAQKGLVNSTSRSMRHDCLTLCDVPMRQSPATIQTARGACHV
jgi:hypothetical protein